MNSFHGKIVEVVSSSSLSYVTVECRGDHVGVMMIDTVETNPSLVVGKRVRFGFKQTDVILTSVKVEGSSLCFEGEVVALEKGEVLSSVVIQWRDEKIDALIPVATTSWVKVGSSVFVHIPPSHIFLLKGDHGE